MALRSVGGNDPPRRTIVFVALSEVTRISATRHSTSSERLPLHNLPTAANGQSFALLDGVRVLDVTSSIAGPYGTLLLGDLGADVVKVERDGQGDDTRAWGPPFLDGDALWFLAVNRNKRSIALDFREQSSRDLLARLACAADVVVTTLREPQLAKLGIEYSALRVRRPDLIYCTITGYGLTGPNHALPGYDLIAEGVSGIMDLTGESTTGPQKVGAPAADMLAGMDAAFAIVAALFDRERTKKGHHIDVSLVESMTRLLAPKLTSYLGSGELQRRTGGKDSVIAVYQVFDTSDEPITLALGNDKIYARFCAAVGRDDLAADTRFSSNAGRREHREHLVREIQAILRERTASQWLRVFSDADIPAGPINHLESAAADPHLIDRGMFYQYAYGDRAIPQVNTGWHLDFAANTPRRPPPQLGADADAIVHDWLAATVTELPQ
jgi:crotonobetainyl-CoA:carnitine CoA-transferase CaiB-like acyl-CoA transferase